PRPAVGVEEDTIDTLERLFAIGPAVAIMRDLQSWNRRQTFAEEKNTGVELVLHRSVARLPGEHQEFLTWGVGKDGRRRQGADGSSGGAQKSATRKSEVRVHNQRSLRLASLEPDAPASPLVGASDSDAGVSLAGGLRSGEWDCNSRLQRITNCLR